VIALAVTVEDAAHPLQVLSAGEAQLLRESRRRRGVEQRRVDGVDARGRGEGSAGDAGRERGRVADHEDVAIGVRGDGRDRGATELVLEIEIAEEELVRGVLVELRELTPVPQLDLRTGGGVGIAEDVEIVDAIPS